LRRDDGPGLKAKLLTVPTDSHLIGLKRLRNAVDWLDQFQAILRPLFEMVEHFEAYDVAYWPFSAAPVE
jgi:hypothetical protein